MHTLFYLGIIFILGSLVQWLSPKLSLPKVVGYLPVGGRHGGAGEALRRRPPDPAGPQLLASRPLVPGI